MHTYTVEPLYVPSGVLLDCVSLNWFSMRSGLPMQAMP